MGKNPTRNPLKWAGSDEFAEYDYFDNIIGPDLKVDLLITNDDPIECQREIG